QRMFHLPDDLPAVLGDGLGQVERHLLSELIVRCKDEPILASVLQHGTSGSDGRRVCVPRPMETGGAAVLIAQASRARSGRQRDLSALARNVLDPDGDG